ncbi:MAG: type IV pilin N-terminal domain-containing protein [Candidatus Bathyarchaeia archaeon]
MKKLKLNRKGVSPVIAVLLMIAIAVAASILVYVWSMGLIGTLQTGGGQQLREQVILEEYSWDSSGLNLYLRNVGASDVIVDTVYVAGKKYEIDAKTLKVHGPVETVEAKPTGTFTDGVAYTVKVVTKTGGIFTFSCIYGGTAATTVTTTATST